MIRTHGWKLSLLLLLAGCDPGEVVLLAPEKRASETPGLSVHAVVDTPFATIATSLGWTDGVPGADVRVHRMNYPYDESYWTVAVTDGAGIATFFDLLAGLYEVVVSRTLDSTERGQLPGGEHVLAGGRRLYLPAAGAQDVTGAPDGRGALVFGEFSLDYPGYVYTLPALDAKYFEVHNNADTTIYLDGKYWGVGWDTIVESERWGTCDQTSAVRNDPEGIWTRIVFQFPGAGNDYPLDPGGTVLVARAAIDHTQVHPDLPDLTHADFEWGGEVSPDNPDVPNLQQIGLEVAYRTVPRIGGSTYLSESVPLETLQRYVDPATGDAWVRIPRALVLDVWVGAVDWTTYTFVATPACLEATHRYFERLPGPAAAHTDPDFTFSAQRRVLYTRPDGRKVLQDTDTSMEDFVKAPRSPGWIPDSLGR